MFLDKVVKGVNAIQTISILNRKHPEKEQADIMVVDFTSNSKNIFDAFNRHRKGSPYKETEPDKAILEKVYSDIREYGVFTDEEVSTYIDAYSLAEEKARVGNSTTDAYLSNMNQRYRQIFKEKLKTIDQQRSYLSFLNRYTKLFCFIAQFYELDKYLERFIVFAEVMSNILIKRGKTSELTQLLKNVELKKGAVKYHGEKSNPTNFKEPRKTTSRVGSGRDEIPRSTIDEALKSIEDKYDIGREDAIVIKEICEEVSSNYEIRRIIDNKDNKTYLRTSAEPKVKVEVKNGYIKRNMWE